MWTQPVPAHTKKLYKKGLQEGILTHMPFSLLWVWLRTFSNAFSIGAVNGPPRCLVPSFSAALVPGYLGLKKKGVLPKNLQSLHQKTQMFLFPLPRAGGAPSPLPPRAPCESFQPNNYSATIYLSHSRMENFQRYSYQEKKINFPGTRQKGVF